MAAPPQLWNVQFDVNGTTYRIIARNGPRRPRWLVRTGGDDLFLARTMGDVVVQLFDFALVHAAPSTPAELLAASTQITNDINATFGSPPSL